MDGPYGCGGILTAPTGLGRVKTGMNYPPWANICNFVENREKYKLMDPIIVDQCQRSTADGAQRMLKRLQTCKIEPFSWSEMT